MIKRLVISWLITAVALGIAAFVIPSVEISGGILGLILAAAAFGIVNALVGPVLHLLSLPLTVVTLGLFALVVNGALLALAAGLSDDLQVGGLLATIAAALIISVVAGILHLLVPDRQH